MSDIYLEAENVMQICGMRNQYEDPATYSATKDAVVFAMRHYCESVEKSELNALREELHKCTNHAKECVNTPLMSQVLAERDKLREEVENMLLNLAGCSTYAFGYGLDDPPANLNPTRAAVGDVLRLAYKERAARQLAERYAEALRKIAKPALGGKQQQWIAQEALREEKRG